uniref:ribonuclease H n=1 Tax=Gouania willdenowi TaxID=441366 RepID=A0A8C5D775_GOUWI
MDQGILSKVDWSEWATPIVPVAKKSSERVRICGDFKGTVNPVLHAVQYPLPRIDDIFASLANGEHFTKIDLAQAYLQMEMDENSRKYLTINTHKGLYQYNRLVFGITSAPAIWQRAMDQVLQGIPSTQCYLDDIIVTGSDKDSHLANLDAVLTKLEDYGLKANKKKCEFFKECIEYCGHKIDKNGLHKTQDKIEAIVNSPQPENVSQLRSFLGLINYYHKFLPNLSSLLHPLNGLLHQNTKWSWTDDCEQAFKKAKRLIVSEKVLTHFDPKLPLRLACDASPYGIGAVLSHKMTDGSERPIAFASRSLAPAERNYAQIDREALSLVWGVKKFNQYLYGKHFTLITDHQPLISIFSPQKGVPAMAAARLQRWALFLGAHTYTIEYR